MWISMLIAAVIIADAYMLVHGYKPWLFEWTKKDNKEMPNEEAE